MEELTLTTTTHKVKINGEVFSILQSDMDIIKKAVELESKYKSLAKGKKQPFTVLLSTVEECADIIEGILGKGAVAKIAGDNPVGINDLLVWLKAITGTVTRIYLQDIESKYE